MQRFSITTNFFFFSAASAVAEVPKEDDSTSERSHLPCITNSQQWKNRSIREGARFPVLWRTGNEAEESNIHLKDGPSWTGSNRSSNYWFFYISLYNTISISYLYIYS
jgi:hypothetical protein